MPQIIDLTDAQAEALIQKINDETNAGGNKKTEVASVFNYLRKKAALENILYADLVEKVENSELIAGRQYRITDYVTTVRADLDLAISAGNPFDIIVTADSENKLNENARAIRHEGDVYFPEQVKFEAWELKYTIENNPLRHDWADSVNGKGVIYFMKDEYGNELSYDFKNVKFKRYQIISNNQTPFFALDSLVGQYLMTQHLYGVFGINSSFEYLYTFSYYGEDLSISNYDFYVGYDHLICNNKIKECFSQTTVDDVIYKTLLLNNNVIVSNGFGQFSNNVIGYNSGNNTFMTSCSNNLIGDNFNSNFILDKFLNNIIGNMFQYNIVLLECRYNNIQNFITNCLFGKYLHYLSICSNVASRNFFSVSQLYEKNYHQKLISTANKVILEWYNDAGTRQFQIIN